ncbi:hypothetical protein VXN63_01775 [Marinilactibacillus sp. XAAS-LB27]|uniref:hypothetical protein n=1 Tax=Marinilactibacillus sp. XAAS-LB27 TaxID=3114538 RepID=UPI002E193FD5|nr:hypothetical protein [Marinilactibacillus sp. XAAS-LB27]
MSLNKLLKEFKTISNLKSTGEEVKQTSPQSLRNKVIYISGGIFGFLAFTIGMAYIEESDLFIFVGIMGMMIMMYSIQKLVEGMMD